MSERSYRILVLVLEKLSHALRTPLGVNRGVLQDAVSGFDLDSSDYQDALDANTELLKCLDMLRASASTFSSDPKEISSWSVLVAQLPSSEQIELHEPMCARTAASDKAILEIFQYLSKLFLEVKRDAKYFIASGTSSNEVAITISTEQGLPYPLEEGFLDKVAGDSRLFTIHFSLGSLLCRDVLFQRLDENRCVINLMF
jgi:hypothetical protein